MCDLGVTQFAVMAAGGEKKRVTFGEMVQGMFRVNLLDEIRCGWICLTQVVDPHLSCLVHYVVVALLNPLLTWMV